MTNTSSTNLQGMVVAGKELIDVSLEGETQTSEDTEHLQGIRLVTIVISLMLAVFCVALDNTIIATAIPHITDTFSTVDDIGWYGAAYLLTTCCECFSKSETASINKVFLIALLIFEAGSAVCGAAPTSTSFIVGRAVAGVGAAGLFTGAATVVAIIAPLHLRPIIAGLLGGLFGICSILGPLLGGVFTSKATWRWCFYINLPIGAITAIVVGILLHIKQRFSKATGTVIQRFLHFDPAGNTLLVSAIICLLLALHWGGSTYAYSNGRIIALFALFGTLLIGFIFTQTLQQETATVPSRVTKQRSIRFVTLFAFSIGGTIYPIVYYLSIWFQVIKNLSPILSAVHTLPMIFSQLCGTITAGILTTRLGYYVPFIWASAILMPIGAGLFMTTTVGISEARSFGYQILLGFGFVFGFQQGSVTCQTVLPTADTAIGTAVTFSVQLLGGAIFLSASQNVFTTHLSSAVSAMGIPGVNGSIVAQAGATEIRQIVPAEYIDRVLVAYNNSITKVYQIALVMTCLAGFGALGVEWKSVRAKTASTKTIA